jgi:hypothetical protein
MTRSKIYLLAVIVLIIIILFVYQYLFSIYEVTYSVEPKILYADNKSETVIEVIPLNAWGWRAPLRNAPAKFEIKEGADLIEIIQQYNEKGMLILKAKSSSGKVIILVRPKTALLPTSIEIIIHPNFAQNVK